MPIQKSTRSRLIILCGGIITMAGAVAWAALTSWEQFEELARHIHEEELGSFHIADVFQANLMSVTYTLVRLGTGDAAFETQRFERQSQELNRWLDERKAVLTTPREREVLAEIDRAYDSFLAAGREVIAAEGTGNHKLVLDALEKATQASQPLLELGTALAAANRAATWKWREELRQSIHRLQSILFGSLAGLLAMGGAASLFVYRHLVAPLRRQLVEARDLMVRQEKLASLGVLAAGVAHEIRNPLTAINLRLYTLQQELEGTKVGEEDTSVIAKEIGRLERIVNDFLQFARPSEPRLLPRAAGDVCAEVTDLLIGELAKRGIQLELAGATDSRVAIDQSQIKQVLLNLVRNAAESMTGAGKITLRVHQGSYVLRDRLEECVVIDVVDTGVGISADVQRRLFDPFFSTKETGTGLGLSIAARIIEAHRGVLKFETSPGGGTTFSIMLPRHNA